MTISALILGKQFYDRKPSMKFAYATIGLLFVNVSVGGTLTHFAAPPVLMVAGTWHWDMAYMFTNFGWKAVCGILISNTLYFFIFRSEFKKMQENEPEKSADATIDWDQREDKIPIPITVLHIIFLIWTVYCSHYPSLFIPAQIAVQFVPTARMLYSQPEWGKRSASTQPSDSRPMKQSSCAGVFPVNAPQSRCPGCVAGRVS